MGFVFVPALLGIFGVIEDIHCVIKMFSPDKHQVHALNQLSWICLEDIQTKESDSAPN